MMIEIYYCFFVAIGFIMQLGKKSRLPVMGINLFLEVPIAGRVFGLW